MRTKPTAKSDWTITITAVWALLAILHILSFPLLSSAASGYTNPTLPYIQLPDESSVPYSSANITGCFVIVDGDRLGLGTDFPVTGGPSIVPVEGTTISVSQSVSVNFANVYSYIWNSQNLVTELAANGDPVSSTEVPVFHPSKYPGWKNGYDYTEYAVPWTFTNKTALYPGTVPYNSSLMLDEALLNVSGSLLHFRDNNTCHEDLLDCYDPTGAYRLCVNDESMPQDWTPSTFCAADPSFTWGFSSRLAFLGLIFELIWGLTTYAFWMRAHRYSVFCRYGIDLRSPYENAALLTSVMEEVLGDGDRPLDRKQIKEAMNRAGNVSLVVHNRSSGEPARVLMTTRSRGRRTKGSLERRLKRLENQLLQNWPL